MFLQEQIQLCVAIIKTSSWKFVILPYHLNDLPGYDPSVLVIDIMNSFWYAFSYQLSGIPDKADFHDVFMSKSC